MKDRRRGALIGLAVGDALGTAVEFSSPGTFAPVVGYRSGGPHGLQAGEWTDDTSMYRTIRERLRTNCLIWWRGITREWPRATCRAGEG